MVKLQPAQFSNWTERQLVDATANGSKLSKQMLTKQCYIIQPQIIR